MKARVAAMQACCVIFRKVDGGIKICVFNLMEFARSIEIAICNAWPIGFAR